MKTLLYPAFCLLCKQDCDSNHALCQQCQTLLPYYQQRCYCYGQAMLNSQYYCANCLQPPLYFQSSIIPFLYQPPIDHWIKQLKYQHQLFYTQVLANLFLDYLLCQSLVIPDVIIPVPLHTSKLRQRGFNQSLELAKPIAKALNIPLDYYSSMRCKNTSSQTQLDTKARHRNIKKAFVLENPPNYQNIAIIDDVMTTGATVNEFAKLWQQAGVANIQIWAIASA